MTVRVTLGPGPRELEGVLQQVDHDRRDDLAVGVHRQSGLARRARVSWRPRAVASMAADGDNSSIRSATTKSTAVLRVVPEADLGDRAIDEVGEPGQAALEHRAGAAADADVPGPEHFERHAGRVDQVADLVGEEAEALVLLRGGDVAHRLMPFTSVLRHRAGDGIVQAAIERAEVVDADRRVLLHREVGDRLADVAVVVHDLRHGEPLQTQLAPVMARR